MKRKLSIAAISVVVAFGALVWFQTLNAPIASPDSPAVGTWRKGGLTFILKSDGKGQVLLGRRHTAPLDWTEKNGFVTIVDYGMPKLPIKYSGQLSADEKTLNIIQSRGKNFPLSLKKTKINWLLKKQPT